MKRQFSVLLLTLALLSLSAPAVATVIYVSGDQTGTWSADTVIVTAEVRVPPGQSLTISPGVEVLFSVYCKFIVDSAATLHAVGTPADSIRFDVLPPDTAWHGIRFLSASDSSRLEYCLLTHGSATGGGVDNFGGAIYCFSSSPTISHNTICGNSAYLFGGGIACWYNSRPNISGNTLSGNTTNGDGGGIFCETSGPNISGNTLSANSASGGGGGIYCTDYSSPNIGGNTISGNTANGNGGGIYCYISGPNISGNTLSANSAGSGGGGIYCGGGSPNIGGNTISGNTANGNGGGIYCYISGPNISGNTISANSARSGGGGICCAAYSSPTISSNTICENSAGNGGGICYYLPSSTTLANCILWGNSPQQTGRLHRHRKHQRRSSLRQYRPARLPPAVGFALH